jgi:ABC-type glutathione transport system ATPase component
LKLTLLLISHNLALVAQISDRVAILESGRLVHIGKPDEVFRKNPHPYAARLLASKFAMLPLGKDSMLGLWEREDVKPHTGNETGGAEVAFTVANADAVRTTHNAWKARALKIAQEPTAMNFGHTFVAVDPEDHRLRVFTPAA